MEIYFLINYISLISKFVYIIYYIYKYYKFTSVIHILIRTNTNSETLQLYTPSDVCVLSKWCSLNVMYTTNCKHSLFNWFLLSFSTDILNFCNREHTDACSILLQRHNMFLSLLLFFLRDVIAKCMTLSAGQSKFLLLHLGFSLEFPIPSVVCQLYMFGIKSL